MTTPFPFVSGAVLTAQQLNDIQNLPISDKTASYTLIAGDETKRTIMNNASATTITVNNSIFTVGDVIQVANKGAGTCTITAGVGVTINTSGSLALTQYSGGYLLALSASTFTFFNLGGGGTKIGQVVSTLKTDTFTTTSTTFTDITGLSVSITPTLSTSKVLVTFTVQAANTASKTGYMQLMRDSTAIAIGDAAGSRSRSTVLVRTAEDNIANTVSIMFLDSPATTSATTYKLQGRTESGATLFINRDNGYGNTAAYSTEASTITVMEVIV